VKLRIRDFRLLCTAATVGYLGSIGVGLRYAAGRRDLLGTYIVDRVGMFMAVPTSCSRLSVSTSPVTPRTYGKGNAGRGFLTSSGKPVLGVPSTRFPEISDR
jgi:hypothetical protein